MVGDVVATFPNITFPLIPRPAEQIGEHPPSTMFRMIERARVSRISTPDLFKAVEEIARDFNIC